MKKLAIGLSVLFLMSLSPLKVVGSAMTSVNQVEINLGKWEPSEEHPPSFPKPPAGESVIETTEVKKTEQKKLPQTDEKVEFGYVLVGCIVIVVASIAVYYKKVKHKKLT